MFSIGFSVILPVPFSLSTTHRERRLQNYSPPLESNVDAYIVSDRC